jgi:hypothetical protein
MAACPYETRFFWYNDPPDVPETENIEYHADFQAPHTRGTVVKCDYCVHDAYNGQLPACINACSKSSGREALYYGDLNEDAVSNGVETLELSTVLADQAGYRFQEEDGTKPSVWYLPPAGQGGSSTTLNVQLGIEILDVSNSNQSVKAAIHATLADGSPLPHAEVLVQRQTTFGSVMVAKGLTDSDGIFNCTFRQLPDGESVIKAELQESERYARKVVTKTVIR